MSSSEARDSRHEPRHPIQVVARRTGITPDALRAWEKRYKTVRPQRVAGGRRLYSDEDIRRLLLLKRATAAGRRIGDVAALSTADLSRLIEQDAALEKSIEQFSEAHPHGDEREAREDVSLLEGAIGAVRELDLARLEATLARAHATIPAPRLMEEVLAPLLEWVGRMWKQGSLGVAHEHMASAAIRSLIGPLASPSTVPTTAPAIVVTTPAGQIHELGALMVAASAASVGWRPLYLGPSLPAHEIAEAARSEGARAVALSMIYPEADPYVLDEVRRLRHLLDESTALLIGGRAASGHRAALIEAGASVLEGFRDFIDELETLA